LVAALLVVPLYWHYLFLDVDIYTLTSELGQQAATFSADLLSWLLPSALNPLWGEWTAPIYSRFTTINLMETTLFVGYLPLLLFGASWLMRAWSPMLRFWQLLTLIAVALSFGPTLHINGATFAQGLPYHWLLLLPGFDGFRIPSRAGITAALAFSVVAMLTAQRLHDRYQWHGRWWYRGLTLLMIGYLINVIPFFPHPITDVRVPAIYDALADIDPTAAILELPAGEFGNNGYNFFIETSLWLAYQPAHHHPTVSGYLGRRPPRLHEAERTLPFVRRFFQDVPGELAVEQPDLGQWPAPFWPDDIAQAAMVLTDLNIGAVALHCQPNSQPEYCPATIALLTQALGLPTAVDGVHRLYKVNAPVYRTSALPPFFTELPPRYATAFGPFAYTPGARTHRLDASGTLTVTAPLTGTWALQGILSGPEIEEVTLTVDGAARVPRIDRFAADTYGWRLELPWPAGVHTLKFNLPTARNAPAATGCARVCLHNLSIRLLTPTAAVPSASAATFVNTQGVHATLQQSRLLVTPTPPPTVGAPQTADAWLLTVWQVDEALRRTLQDNPTQMPDLFVHLHAADGTVVAQADHPLGAHHLWVDDENLLYDVVALPAGIDRTALRATVGLWYSATADYFWLSTAASTGASTSVTLGPLPPATIFDEVLSAE
jgi:hypothetical protein